MSNPEREKAIKTIISAFTTGVSNQQQIDAVVAAVGATKFNQSKAVLDAVEEEYPATSELAQKRANSILTKFVKAGQAPKAIIDFASDRANQLTAPKQHAIVCAFQQ